MNLSEIKARCEAATPGPWEYTDNGFDGYISSENGAFIVGGEPCEGRIENNADTNFIAHTRADLPACVAEIERLQAENAELKAQKKPCAGARRLMDELADKDAEIERLQAENSILEQALQLSCDDASAGGYCPHEVADYVCPNVPDCPNANENREDVEMAKQCWHEYYIQQAQEEK